MAEGEGQERQTVFEGPGLLCQLVLSDEWYLPYQVVELRPHGGDEVIMRLSVMAGQTVSWCGQVALPNGLDFVLMGDKAMSAPVACASFVANVVPPYWLPWNPPA